MIDKRYEKGEAVYYLVCDICEDKEEGPFDSFDEAVDYQKGTGWAWTRGQWANVCPSCGGVE